jgi:UDP-N-acetylmuramoyl-tripeptide--D-alanyl-D-alanine ligase
LPSTFLAAIATGWSIDTRTLKRADVFFAIKGERFDGHAFLETAFEKGALAAVVSEPGEGRGLLIRVEDTLAALQRLAVWARNEWGRPIVAVTGSAGKTTTKDAIAELLSVRLRVGKTEGNLNNHLGLPLSLLRMDQTAEVGVMELGMNHTGEIRFLASVAKPNIGVVTNVGFAHVENFSSIEAIALAKRELVESLGESGTAVLNADDTRVREFAETHTGRVITYGFSESAEVRGENLELASGGSQFEVDGTLFKTQLAGRHGASNVLAAVAAARAFDIKPAELPEAVARIQPGKMRGQREQWNGITILNDCYNSNPDAALSMLDLLGKEAGHRRIAVLGEMLELGDWATELHEKVGKHASEQGIDVVVGITGKARKIVEGAIANGLPSQNAYYFDTPEEAGTFLRRYVKEGDVLLFKGSRGTHIERALARMES